MAIKAIIGEWRPLRDGSGSNAFVSLSIFSMVPRLMSKRIGTALVRASPKKESAAALLHTAVFSTHSSQNPTLQHCCTTLLLRSLIKSLTAISLLVRLSTTLSCLSSWILSAALAPLGVAYKVEWYAPDKCGYKVVSLFQMT